MKFHNSYSSVIASTFTVGFGGSVGLEAPVVLTGSAIGSNLGTFFHLNYKHRILLIGCGAAAVIAGIFKAPVAAVIFSLEVLMLDLTTFSLIPLLISAGSGTALAYFLLGNNVVFSYTVSEPFQLHNLHWYIVLGIISGFYSLYVTKASYAIENLYLKIKKSWIRILAGGSILSLLVFLFPPFFGEGYICLKSILSGNPNEIANYSFFSGINDSQTSLLLFLAFILIFKVLAMASTTGAGGVGGIFAPTLFMGGILGFLFSRLLNLSGAKVSEQNFALVGMAALMAGIMQAPLTAVFLIAEITGGYQLFLPLIFTSAISFLTIHYFEPHSIYTKKLAWKGDLITHHKDKQVLTLMNLKKLIEHDFKTISPDANLGKLVELISSSNRNLFPVLDVSGKISGMIYLDHIREIIFQPDKYEIIMLKELMEPVEYIVELESSMATVMKQFNESGAWNLPVVENGIYCGMISKSKIFNSYRKMIIDFSEE